MTKFFLILLLLTIIGPVWILATAHIDFSADYRTANRESAKLAPLPKEFKDAVILIYAGRAFNWRGIFSTHLWIATKEKNAARYKVYQATGWRLLEGLSTVSIMYDLPDRHWFNSKPTLVYELKGPKAEKFINEIENLSNHYPEANTYTLWPGPNSNSFVAYIARNLPELQIHLPSNAIGKDYLGESKFFANAPSGTGYQFSLFGIFGILIAKKEGLEINILGLVYGIDPLALGIKLPAIGEISLLPH